VCSDWVLDGDVGAEDGSDARDEGLVHVCSWDWGMTQVGSGFATPPSGAAERYGTGERADGDIFGHVMRRKQARYHGERHGQPDVEPSRVERGVRPVAFGSTRA
jgi:hypothetical protein